jgi:hypothetical protein
MEPLGCIYLITCSVVVDGWIKRYVGQSVHTDETIRFKEHWRQRKSRPCLLHNAMIAHGRNAFKTERLCVVPHSALNRMEEYYAEQHQTYMWDSPGGYNMVWAGSGGRLGIPHTPDTIERMRNRPVTADTRERMRDGAESRWTDDYRKQWGEKMRSRDPEIVTKDSTRKLISDSLRVRAQNMSVDQKAKQYSKISGENCKTSKLTEESVRQIRIMKNEGKILAEIATVFNISKASVSRVCRGETWKSVESETK